MKRWITNSAANFLVKLVTLAGPASLLISCQTPQHKSFDNIRVGMEKATVIEVAGGPQKSVRRDAKDRWIYVYHSPTEGDLVREVHFEGGRATYVGDYTRPAVSAEEQDRINESAVEEDKKRETAAQLLHDKQVGILRLQSPEDTAKTTDELDMRLRDSMYGTETYKESGRAKLKHAPEFVPVD